MFSHSGQGFTTRRFWRAASSVAAVVVMLSGAAVFMVANPQSAEASHFRADQLVWTKTSANSADFDLSASYRESYYGTLAIGDTFAGGTLDFGDGTSLDVAFTVTSVDSANDIVSGSLDTSHTYAGAGPYTASYSDCCRLSGPQHINNPDDDIISSTVVDLANATGSPRSTVSPIVDCPVSGICQFAIPAVDPTGGTVTYRMATPAEAGFTYQPGAPLAPNAASIDPTTGVYHWDTTGATLNDGSDPTLPQTLYSTQVVMERRVAGTVVTSSAVDFFIRLGTGTTNNAPIFTAPTPADGSVLPASVGSPFSFSVQSTDPDSGDTVTPGILNLPSGATFAPTPGNPATAEFAWTPGTPGDYVVVLTAADQSGAQATQRSIIIRVGTASSTSTTTSTSTSTSTTTTTLPTGSTSTLPSGSTMRPTTVVVPTTSAKLGDNRVTPAPAVPVQGTPSYTG